MSDDPIERAARAIARVVVQHPDYDRGGFPVEYEVDQVWRDWVPAAQAVIDALHPTPSPVSPPPSR